MLSIKKILPIRQFSSIRIIDESIILPHLKKIYNNLYTLQKIDCNNNSNLKLTIHDLTTNIYILQKQLNINKIINYNNIDLFGHVDRH